MRAARNVEGGDDSVECPELHHGLLEDERLEGPRKARCDLEPHLRGDDTDGPRVSDGGEVLHDKGEGEPEDAADALRGGLCEESLVEDEAYVGLDGSCAKHCLSRCAVMMPSMART